MSRYEEFKLKGLEKYGETLGRDLFCWGRSSRATGPARQKACLVFSVGAYGYSFSLGYSWDTQNFIKAILEAIQFVEERNGLNKSFCLPDCVFAMEKFVSRNRVSFCEGCEIETLKNTVKFRLSYPLVERIQIFLSELGFSPTSC